MLTETITGKSMVSKLRQIMFSNIRNLLSVFHCLEIVNLRNYNTAEKATNTTIRYTSCNDNNFVPAAVKLFRAKVLSLLLYGTQPFACKDVNQNV